MAARVSSSSFGGGSASFGEMLVVELESSIQAALSMAVTVSNWRLKVQACPVDPAYWGATPNTFSAGGLAFDVVDHPFEHAHVLAITGQTNFAISPFAEPVHAEDPSRVWPMLEKVPMSSHAGGSRSCVVAAEREHGGGRRTTPWAPKAAGCCFRAHGGGHVHTFHPGTGLRSPMARWRERRPPKINASMATLFGPSHCGSSAGLLVAATVKRALGWAAWHRFLAIWGVQSLPCQSIRRPGSFALVLSMPSTTYRRRR